jgi:hypothetical protein
VLAVDNPTAFAAAAVVRQILRIPTVCPPVAFVSRGVGRVRCMAVLAVDDVALRLSSSACFADFCWRRNVKLAWCCCAVCVVLCRLCSVVPSVWCGVCGNHCWHSLAAVCLQWQKNTSQSQLVTGQSSSQTATGIWVWLWGSVNGYKVHRASFGAHHRDVYYCLGDG